MPNILIVDDDALMRDALHTTLVRAGYEVEDASGGTAALHAYQRQPREIVQQRRLTDEGRKRRDTVGGS